MSLQHEAKRRSRFKIKYRKKSTPQVPLVIVEQCDLESTYTSHNHSTTNCHHHSCDPDLDCTSSQDPLTHSRLCRSERHSLNYIPDHQIDNLTNVLHKWNSCSEVKQIDLSNEFDVNIQNDVDNLEKCNSNKVVYDYSHGEEFSRVSPTDEQLNISTQLNYSSVSLYLSKTMLQNACNFCPATIQRSKRIETVKQRQPNNSLESKDHSRKPIASSIEDNIGNRLQSVCRLLEDNILHQNMAVYSYIDGETIATSSSCHCFSVKQDDNRIFTLPSIDMRTNLTISSSCSSFNSLGALSSPPSSRMSDTILNDNNTTNTDNNNSNVKRYNRKVITSNPSSYLQLPIVTSTFDSNANNPLKVSTYINTEYDVINDCRIKPEKSLTSTTTTATTNKSRIKSLGDIFKFPRLSVSSDLYPKKSSTYQNINKIDTDNNHYNTSKYESPITTITNDSSLRRDPNFLTVPTETFMRNTFQECNKHVRHSTDYVCQRQQLHDPDEKQQRTQRAVSVDMSQGNHSLLQYDSSKIINMKYANCIQSLYYSGYNKSSQQPLVNSSESLNASTGTLFSHVSSVMPNWTRNAVLGEHLWNDTTSTDTCYVEESECCVPVSCRPTFREAFIRDYRIEKTNTTHHWIKRKKQDNKCKHCGKSLQSILGFSTKEYMTVQCTWCKIGYHNKPTCFQESFLSSEPCSLGPYSDLIVPPDWIIKLSEGNSFKSSIHRSNSFVTSLSLANGHIQTPQIRSSISRPEKLDCSTHIPTSLSDQVSVTTINEDCQSVSNNQVNHCIEPKISFVIKSNPMNAVGLKPLLVFLNPKSGGNQATGLLKKFQWLLNPRQVFDLSKGGPKLGLELFSRVPNLRILVCGGDGTVGWIFSTIDSLALNIVPPVAVLPLGTGNDLARALNWGSGYVDESVSKILSSVYEGRVIALDRWQVNSEVRTDLPTVQQTPDTEEEGDSSKSRPICDALPLKVFNNYFSLGADAATALEFHESREANPEKFNSRLKNKLFYAGCGGKDLLLRSWRDLSEHITLTCDGEDLTPLIRSLKPHCLLFLNIPRYGSGTLPWGNPEAEFQPQRIDDGYIEVIGLTSTTLATLQIGGHGDRICQCRHIRLTTDKVIPMQMDGEPCRLVPSTIEVFCSHQALVIQKLTRSPGSSAAIDENQLRLKTGEYEARVNVFVIAFKDYQIISDDVIALRQAATFFGVIMAKYDLDLSSVREIINQLNNSEVDSKLEPFESTTPYHISGVHLSNSWVFIDSTTAACRFFRIDKKHENAHFLTDVCNMEDLFLIDCQLESPLQNTVLITAAATDSDKNAVQQPASSLQPFETGQIIQCSVNDTMTTTGIENTILKDDKRQLDNSELNIKSVTTKEDRIIHSHVDSGLDIYAVETNLQNELILEKSVTCDQESFTKNDTSVNSKANPFISYDWEDFTKKAQDKNEEKMLINETNEEIIIHYHCKSDNIDYNHYTDDSCLSSITSNDSIDVSTTKPLTDDAENPTTNPLICKNQSPEKTDHSSDFTMISDNKMIKTVREEEEEKRGRENSRRGSEEEGKKSDNLLLIKYKQDSVSSISNNQTIEISVISTDEDEIRQDDSQSCKSKRYSRTRVREIGFNDSEQLQQYLNKAPVELIDLQDNEKKQTALHKAAATQRRIICQNLIISGACPTITDIYGKQPSDLALEANDSQLAIYLQKKAIMFIIKNMIEKINV
ncbi:unnamed protein product [Heterobilharzia americana]|nr:unnamed protein product [Heterobilharzia americana]